MVVADVNEPGRLVLNVGSANGVKQGDRLQVSTKRLLMREDVLLSEAVVNIVNEIS